MSDFRTCFNEFYIPSPEAKKRALLEGLVCLDTNVLLDAYRFAPGPRSELIDALKRFEDRLWIPHQVALEFHRNRIKVISKQGQAYKELLEELESLREAVHSDALDKARALSKTIAALEGKPEAILGPIEQGLDEVIERIIVLRDAHGITLDQIEADPVLLAFEDIFNGRIGEKLSEEDEREARKEADRRVRSKTPPGYKDAANKDDPAGDYLIWRQLLLEATARKLPVLFVTRDVKEDWFRREGGRTLSARPELIREAREVAGVDVVIMETKSFLYQVREHMTNRVSSNLIRQVEELPPIASNEGKAQRYERAVLTKLTKLGFSVELGVEPPISYLVRTPQAVTHVIINYFPANQEDYLRRARELQWQIKKSSADKLVVITNRRPEINLHLLAYAGALTIVTWGSSRQDHALEQAILQNSVTIDTDLP